MKVYGAVCLIVVFGGCLVYGSIGYTSPEFGNVRAFRMYHFGSEKGEIIFVILDNVRGIFSSPLRVETVIVSQDNDSIMFAHPVRADWKWVIQNVWNSNRNGYRCTLAFNDRDIVGYAKPIGNYNVHKRKSITKHDSFRFYGRKGDVDVYDMSNGKRTDGGPDNEMSKEGEMLFVIRTENVGRLYGNAGSSWIDVFRDNTSIVFLETTLTDSKQITIVLDRWNPKHKGFECIHIRNTILANFTGDKNLVRGIYKGIAKPE